MVDLSGAFSLDPATISRLTPLLHLKEYGSGKVVIRQNSKPTEFLFLLEGFVDVYRLAKGRSMTFARLGPGTVLGDLAIFLGHSHSVQVKTVTSCRFASLHVAHKAELFGLPGSLSWLLLRQTYLSLEAADFDRLSLCAEDVPARLLRVLTFLPFSPEDATARELPSHRDLARMIGTSREVVTRGLRKLREKGLIAVDGTRVRVKKHRTV